MASASPAVDIFVSYAHADQHIAAIIEANLRKAGFSVWRDASQIRGGQVLGDVVQNAVSQARCVVVCLSEPSVRSPWVRAEISAGRHKLVLAKIEGFPMPADLGAAIAQSPVRDLQPWLAGENSGPWKQVIEDCRQTIARPARAPVAPAQMPTSQRVPVAGRPMIQVEMFSPRSALALGSNNQLQVTVPYRLRNCGNAPAKGVLWSATLYPFRGPYVPEGSDECVFPPDAPVPESRLRDICKQLANQPCPRGAWEREFLPNYVIESETYLAQDFAKFQGPAAEGANGDVLPLIFACTTYFSAYDDSYHQTGLVFAIFLQDASEESGRRHLRLRDLPVGAGEMIVEAWGMGGNVMS